MSKECIHFLGHSVYLRTSEAYSTLQGCW